MRFASMGTGPTGLREKDRGAAMSWPSRPKGPGQEAHDRGGLKRYVIDKSYKIGK
jgi:hypothetical protein